VSAPDFSIRSEGSLVILLPLSESGRDWCDEHLPPDAPRWAGGYAIEARHYRPIIDGIVAAGLGY